jgi:hypothetical protein
VQPLLVRTYTDSSDMSDSDGDCMIWYRFFSTSNQTAASSSPVMCTVGIPLIAATLFSRFNRAADANAMHALTRLRVYSVILYLYCSCFALTTSSRCE